MSTKYYHPGANSPSMIACYFWATFKLSKCSTCSDRGKSWPVFLGKSQSKSVETVPSHCIYYRDSAYTIAPVGLEGIGREEYCHHVSNDVAYWRVVQAGPMPFTWWNWRGGGGKLENFETKKPKSTLLADNTGGLRTTKQTKPRPVASVAPHPITPVKLENLWDKCDVITHPPTPNTIKHNKKLNISTPKLYYGRYQWFWHRRCLRRFQPDQEIAFACGKRGLGYWRTENYQLQQICCPGLRKRGSSIHNIFNYATF